MKDDELFKGGVHLLLFGAASVCLAYNTMRASAHATQHSIINVGAYAALVWFEYRQIRHHLRKAAA